MRRPIGAGVLLVALVFCSRAAAGAGSRSEAGCGARPLAGGRRLLQAREVRERDRRVRAGVPGQARPELSVQHRAVPPPHGQRRGGDPFLPALPEGRAERAQSRGRREAHPGSRGIASPRDAALAAPRRRRPPSRRRPSSRRRRSRRRAATLGPASPPAALDAPAPTSTPVSTTPTVENGAPSSQTESQPIYHKWWFWTGVGAVVVGGIILIAATAKHDPSCPGGVTCGN